MPHRTARSLNDLLRQSSTAEEASSEESIDTINNQGVMLERMLAVLGLIREQRQFWQPTRSPSPFPPPPPRNPRREPSWNSKI